MQMKDNLKDTHYSCIAPWRLPEHVELARVVQAESVEYHGPHHQLGSASLGQILDKKSILFVPFKWKKCIH